jgi:hydrogenase nickel incorporation protein HypA/HybF
MFIFGAGNFKQMHELTIAMEIIDIANQYSEKANKSIVKEIEIEAGELSGVEYDALAFALDISKKGTVLENAKINIEKTEGRAKCNDCRTEFPLNNLYTPCPRCGKYDFTIISGKELRVKSITID